MQTGRDRRSYLERAHGTARSQQRVLFRSRHSSATLGILFVCEIPQYASIEFWRTAANRVCILFPDHLQHKAKKGRPVLLVGFSFSIPRPSSPFFPLPSCAPWTSALRLLSTRFQTRSILSPHRRRLRLFATGTTRPTSRSDQAQHPQAGKSCGLASLQRYSVRGFELFWPSSSSIDPLLCSPVAAAVAVGLGVGLTRHSNNASSSSPGHNGGPSSGPSSSGHPTGAPVPATGTDGSTIIMEQVPFLPSLCHLKN
jgi:hypothetical protein